jgi:hypothetical protein
MKKFLAACLLYCGVALGQYYPPAAMSAQNPSGQMVYVGMDGNGNLYTNGSGSASVASAISGYVAPVALTGQGPTGQQIYLKTDAYGNLYINCQVNCGGAASDGIHAGYAYYVGNTTDYAVVPFTWGEMGPTITNYSGWAEQPASSTSGGPANYSLKLYSPPVNGISQWSLQTPLTQWIAPQTAALNGGGLYLGANTIEWGPTVNIPAPGLTITHISFLVWGADTAAGNHYDICIWNTSGTLVADTGPILSGSGNPFGTTGTKDITIAATWGNSVTIPGGSYLIGWTGTAVTGQIAYSGSSGSAFTYYGFTPGTSTTGGQCGNVTMPSLAASGQTANGPGIGYEVGFH